MTELTIPTDEGRLEDLLSEPTPAVVETIGQCSCIQHELPEASEPPRRGENTGMPRHPTHAASCRIVHHSAQHPSPFIVFGRRDLGPPGYRGKKTGVRHLQWVKDLLSAVHV